MNDDGTGKQSEAQQGPRAYAARRRDYGRDDAGAGAHSRGGGSLRGHGARARAGGHTRSGRRRAHERPADD